MNRVVRGDLVLHPVFLVALVVLLSNDQVWKARYGNAVTGKLSDVAGLIVVPILIAAMLELVTRRRTTTRVMVVCTAITALVFAAVQLWAPAGEVYEVIFGLLRWPIDAIVAVASGASIEGPQRVALWRDTTDLIALPACVVPVWLATTSAREHRFVAG